MDRWSHISVRFRANRPTTHGWDYLSSVSNRGGGYVVTGCDGGGRD